jgi:hypothetical protein
MFLFDGMGFPSADEIFRRPTDWSFRGGTGRGIPESDLVDEDTFDGAWA